ncbi:hypothetical protein JA1_001319 [Spathaspora sp. JA1]|nr:hypothetical protein JA1_001319 [Spathaspora sp. JA1]
MTSSDLIGTHISIPGSPPGYGIVKYIGEIQGKTGVFVGIELLGNLAISRGKNSGSVNGIEYFNVRISGSGLFLPYDRVRAVNTILPERSEVNFSRISSPGSRTVSLSRVTPDSVTPDRKSSDMHVKYELEIASLKRIIQEKDKRLENFNIQRQEWRAAMDELVSVQQDGIEVFEAKIHELEAESNMYKQQVERLNSELALSGDAPKLHIQAQAKIVQLEKEIESLLSTKVNNVDINSSDLHKQVAELTRELESRPKVDNILNLQQELDELDSIYHQQLDEKDQQIKQLEQEITRLKLNPEQDTDSLPIYRAPVVVDPSSGKIDWCGLCERDGHSSINCPYENDDIF